jgi:spermidine/putrescine-binding protein
MFRTLARALVLAGAAAALALPAFAAPAQVAINVAKLDAPAVHKAIAQAARQACFTEFADQTATVTYYARPDCVRHTVAKAEADYKAMTGLASR